MLMRKLTEVQEAMSERNREYAVKYFKMTGE